MNPERPSPDELLLRVKEEESKRARGKLTIFFGAAPGVGKTFAMLAAARAERRDGREVVLGVVETHGRKETAALMDELESLPRRRVEYRGVFLEEFDLDAALARRPALLLVDELAHSNAEGSRHRRRWQDVEELLQAGIDVYTTLNVQHVESLNDVVAQVTGILVKETVPDSILEKADEVHLIDLPPDELLERLREGKVYLPEQARRAVENFFRKGNLIALRELALRQTATRVDAEMQAYRREHGIERTWAAGERVLVCVSPSPHSARLIRAATRMAATLHAPLLAVYAEALGASPTTGERERLAANLALAEQLGAESRIIATDSPVRSIIDFARERNVTKIVVGKPTHPRWRDRIRPHFMDEIVRASGEIDVHVISGEGREATREGPVKRGPRLNAGEVLASIAVVAAATALSFEIFGRTQLADVVMIYLLGIVLVAMRLGRGPSLLAAVLSIVSFDFFFVPPYISFAVSDFSHVTTFGVMFFVAFVISSLAGRVRKQAESAQAREHRTYQLYVLSRKLSETQTLSDVARVAIEQLKDVFDCDAAIILADESGKLRVEDGSIFALDDKELGVAEWVWSRKKPAGAGTDTLPSAKGLYLPLQAGPGRVGVLGARPRRENPFRDAERRQLLETFSVQMASALERLLAVENARKAQIQVETEQLRSSLLSSVSHDLRTPLAVVKGAASALVEGEATIGADERRSFAQAIVDEADRLNRLVRNLLDMTRVESGSLRAKKEWQSIEEVVGTALARLEDRVRDRDVVVRLPEGMSLVPFDGLLVEQILINLIENATRHAPAPSPIEITASLSSSEAEIVVADRGPGIPAGDEEKIFDKFYRAHPSQGGIGLGLAICRGMVAVHGGRIWAKTRDGGGAELHFTLPIEGEPPKLELVEVEGAGMVTAGENPGKRAP